MKIYAIVENNIVVNRTQAESPMADNWIESGIARVGDFWDGESFTAPPAPLPSIPKVVSRAQFILALLEIGLLDEVEAVIEQADRATQINYRERLEFERDFPLISTMAAVLGKTDAEIDALFLLAATK